MKTKRYFLLFIFSGALLLLNSCKQESLKRTERDISGEEPFKSIVGKTLTTKQSCYIGNYDDSADDFYTMAMNEDYFLNAKTYYKLAVGTKINIDKTVIFQGEGSRFALKTIVGSVFIPELNKEVPFEYVWRPEPPDNIGEDRFDYEVYPLAPWQEHPLPFKYSIYDTSFSEYNWPAKSRNQLFNDLMETIPIAEALTENRDFSNTTFKRLKNEDENYYFVGESGTIPRNQLYLLQLDMIHSKFFDTTIKFSIGRDCRLHLSQNFSTVILTGLFNNDQMISSLVNYDLEGNYIGHIDITVSNQPSKAILSSDFSALMTEKRIHTLTNDSKIVVHQITETGEVISTVENGQNLDLHECLYVKDNSERVE